MLCIQWLMPWKWLNAQSCWVIASFCMTLWQVSASHWLWIAQCQNVYRNATALTSITITISLTSTMWTKWVCSHKACRDDSFAPWFLFWPNFLLQSLGWDEWACVSGASCQMRCRRRENVWRNMIPCRIILARNWTVFSFAFKAPELCQRKLFPFVCWGWWLLWSSGWTCARSCDTLTVLHAPD